MAMFEKQGSPFLFDEDTKDIVALRDPDGSYTPILNPGEVMAARHSIAGPLSAVAKLKQNILSLNDLSVTSDVPTITQLGPNAGNQIQASGITNAVTVYAQDVIAGTNEKITMFSKENWTVTATTSGGYKFYSGPASGGTDSGPTATIAFFTDAPVVEIGNRGDESWQFFVDGKPVASTMSVTNTGTSYKLTRTVLTFSARKRRKIVAYAQTTGFYCVSVGPNDTVEPIDTSAELSVAAMSDSYGGISNVLIPGGPMMWAMRRLNVALYANSPGGGSGYDTLGNSSRPNALSRLPYMTAINPDIFLTCLGINDPYPMANVSSYWALAREYLPSSLLICTGPWTPDTARQTSGIAKNAQIKAAFQAVAGPSIYLDNINGTYWSKDRLGNVRTGIAGNGLWMTGNGTTTTTTGSGNGDIYNGDGTHYNSAGSQYLGNCMASGIAAAVVNMAA